MDAETCIRAYHDDVAWKEEVRAYTGASPASRAAEATPGSAADREAHEIARLECMAREDYKLSLHRDWLAALASAIEPGRPFHVLDYGCGASSYSALALGWREVHCTQAEANEVLLGYLRWRAARRSDGRVRVVALPVRGDGREVTARLRVEVGAIDGRFDAIVLADILEHTLDPLRVLTHLLERLRPGGIALVNYPSEIEGDWHTPEAYFQRAACFWLLRLCSRYVGGHARLRRRGPLPALALVVARLAEPVLRRGARRFARRVFQEQGAALVAQVREKAGREISVGDLLADV